MPPSTLTSENSAIVMIDHAVGFGNVFRSHDLSLHVNNTVGLAKTAGVFGIPLVLTNGADTGPYGPLFSELRIVTGGARVIVREGNFINAFQTPRFAAAIESAGRRKLVMSGLLTEGCVLGTALAGLERGSSKARLPGRQHPPHPRRIRVTPNPPDRCTGTRDA